jgi:hypothetical protein
VNAFYNTYIAATDTGLRDVDNNIMGVLENRPGAVLNHNVLDSAQDKRWVLYFCQESSEFPDERRYIPP